VVAIGKAEFIKGDWIKPGAVVIDVGTNAIEGKYIHSNLFIQDMYGESY